MIDTLSTWGPDKHPLVDALLREGSGWSFGQDEDYRVLVVHDTGLWVRFGPGTWARLAKAEPAAVERVVGLILGALAGGVTGRHTLTGTFVVAHNPDGTVSDVGGHTIALERYDRST
jgi:hypothetical protein